MLPGVALASVAFPVGATAAQVACDLSFRNLETALRLACKWIKWDRIDPARLGFLDREAYRPSGHRLSMPSEATCARQILMYLLALRQHVHTTLEEALVSIDTIDPRSLPRKNRKAEYAPNQNDSRDEERILLTFDGATPEALREYAKPPFRVAHGGKTSESNVAAEAQSDRTQLIEQINHWRLMDDAVRDLPSIEDHAYFAALDSNPLAVGLDVPEFQRAWDSRWVRHLPPLYDKDACLRPESVVEATTLTNPCSSVEYLSTVHRGDQLLCETVLCDFMETVRYIRDTDVGDLQIPEHWLPSNGDATEWEEGTVNVTLEEPEKTLFMELDTWVHKTENHLSKRPTGRQSDKADMLKVGQQRRIERAKRCLQRPSADELGWPRARQILAHRAWEPHRNLGDGENYLVLAALFYRINHGTEHMLRARDEVDAIDKAEFADKYPPSLTAMDDVSCAAAVAEAVSASVGTGMNLNNIYNSSDRSGPDEDDTPPPFHNMEAEQVDTILVQLAQYQWRIKRLQERVMAHYAAQPHINKSLEEALDRMHHWKVFVYSHLSLARALLDGSGCSDAHALDEDLTSGRLSILTTCYPLVEAAWSQETMVGISDKFRLADAIYAVPSGSATGSVTASAAAAVTSRAGADEGEPRDEDEIIESGYSGVADSKQPKKRGRTGGKGKRSTSAKKKVPATATPDASISAAIELDQQAIEDELEALLGMDADEQIFADVAALDGTAEVPEVAEFDQYLAIVSQLTERDALDEKEERARLDQLNLKASTTGAKNIAVVPISTGTAPSGQPGGQVRPRVSIHSNAMTMLVRKLFPRPCADRDWPSKCDQSCMAHPMCYDFVIDSVFAALGGVYRHSRHPAPFDMALKLDRARDLCARYDAARHVVLAVLFSMNEFVISALRENLVWQMGYDMSLWMLNGAWIQGASSISRAILQYQGHIGPIEAAVSRGFGALSLFAGTSRLPSIIAIATGEPVSMGEPAAGSGNVIARGRGGDTISESRNALQAVPHRPSIFRVTNNGFVSYVARMFQSIQSEAVLVSAANRLTEWNNALDGKTVSSDGKLHGPSIFRLSESAFQLVIWEVQRLRPEAHIPMASLVRIGVSPYGMEILAAVHSLFTCRAHDHTVRAALNGLDPLDFELLSVFFRYLYVHYMRSIVPLDPTTTMRQARALRRHWRIGENEDIPMTALAFTICNIAACREVKNVIAQQTMSNREFGAFWTAQDADIGGVCLSKKTTGVHRRNQSLPPEMRRKWFAPLLEYPAGETPEQRAARIGEHFYGEYQLLERDPTTEVEVCRRYSHPTHAEEIAMKVSLFANALMNATGSRERAEPLDLISDEALLEKLRRNNVAPKQREMVQQAQRMVRELCTKQSRSLEESKYIWPCFRSKVLIAPALGYAVGIEGKKLAPFTPCTVCPQCGSLTAYSIAAPLATGPNGFSCGICDSIDRQRAHAPRCLVCRQNGLTRTATSKGEQGLQWSKDLRKVRVLDDIYGGCIEWRTAYVCWACWAPWMGMDSRELLEATPTPLVASGLLAGWLHGYGQGGKSGGLRQCEDVRRPVPRMFPPTSSSSTKRPGLPPPQFMVAIKKWHKNFRKRRDETSGKSRKRRGGQQ